MFREALVEIISVAGIIGLVLVGVGAYMAVTGREVPEWMAVAIGAIVSRFYNRNGKDKE